MKKYINIYLCGLLLVFTFGFTQVANKGAINEAFSYNEELNYRVHYMWINAARINIKVSDKPTMIDGKKTYSIDAVVRTISSFDYMFKVRDVYRTYVDQEKMVPLKYVKSVEEDNYKDTDLVMFDHDNLTMKGQKKNMEIPENVQDIVSAVFYARTIDFKKAQVGQTFPLKVYLDGEIYDLKFKFIGREKIKADIGKVNCIKLRPQLVVDRVFKDEDDMTIWVSDDENKIPIRVEAKIYVGSVKVDLTNYKNLKNPFLAKT